MPEYLYLCSVENKEFNSVHSITTELESCPICQEANREDHKPKRLISPTNFVLVGGGWAAQGYKK